MENYLKQRRKELGLTMKAVAEAVGVSEGTVSRWESGAIANMRRDRINSLAKILCVSPNFIMTGCEEKQIDLSGSIRPITKKSFPLLGEIACGEPIFAAENIETYIEADSDIKADFCLVCKGNSMINAQIEDGDIVFIRQQSSVDNGQIAAVLIDDEVTLKRVYYYPDDNKVVLNAENPAFPPLVYIGDQLKLIRIIGRAVIMQKEIDKHRKG